MGRDTVAYVDGVEQVLGFSGRGALDQAPATSV
jgi:hypothetical protein